MAICEKCKTSVDAVVIGAGLSGCVIARQLADKGYNTLIVEKRDHIGGNMYDFVDSHGILVHKYGPHTFHTTEQKLYDYVSRFSEWVPYALCCGAEINGIVTDSPFNFSTVDTFFSYEKAEEIKKAFLSYYPGRESVTVVEALDSDSLLIREYAEFLFKEDYSLYTAKQWGVSPEEIDPSVLKRVPLKIGYDKGYFTDEYQVMPKESYSTFFENLIGSDRIKVLCSVDGLQYLKIEDGIIRYSCEIGIPIGKLVVYTGALDELFASCFGSLPYRSLRFEWKYSEKNSIQPFPVVAYPKADKYTRIVEFNKLPYQNTIGSSYELEYPEKYLKGKNEPFYPVITADSMRQYEQYCTAAQTVDNLFLCGRLADFKYYNMDQALKRALEVSDSIIGWLKKNKK